jgi:ABC-type branched-subunit amino acid transport system substrate-binding protein
MKRNDPRLLAGALLAVALCSCGTTVSGTAAEQAARTPGATGTDSLSVPSAGTSPGAIMGGADGLSGPGTVAGGSTGPGTSTIPGSNGSTPAIPPGGSSQQMGLGITDSKIYIGVVYSSGADAANRALGNNITTGDQQADAQAVIDEINSNGGVAGRKLVPIYYDYQTADARPYTTIDSEACAKFTQDNHVFAVAGDGLTDNFDACIDHAGVLLVSSIGQLIGPNSNFFRKYPYNFQAGYVSQDRMMAEEARSLLRQDYYSGWDANTGKPSKLAKAKLGIISFDTPNWSVPLHSVFLPALGRAGHPVNSADVQEVAYPSQTNQIGNSVAQIQSAVLRFRQDGVTHVIVFDGNGSMTLHMLNNMRGQRYYPRLGINSATGAQVLANSYHEDSRSFNGAVGLGWLPLLDLPGGAGDKYFRSATQDCIRMVEKRSGQHFADTNAASFATGYCDELGLIADSINKSGPIVNRDTARAAIEALRGGFPAAGTYGVYFSPAQHDGIDYGYDLRFDTSCNCTKYVNGPFRIP